MNGLFGGDRSKTTYYHTFNAKYDNKKLSNDVNFIVPEIGEFGVV